jgi:hypothetical protein
MTTHTTTWRINHPTLTMRLAKWGSDLLRRPAPPPPGGFVNSLPEAFGARDEHDEVFVIGYQGEWYFPRKPSPLTRVHNWLVGVYNRQLDGYHD